MDISSFNVDVLLHLIDFIDPFDRLNFFFSGIPERFENVKEGLDLQERMNDCAIELKLRRDSSCELEIRSLSPTFDCQLQTMEYLVDRGFLENNRLLRVSLDWLTMGANYRILRDICSMNNLEKLDLIYNELTLEDLALLFRSCPKLNNLQLTNFQLNKQEKEKDEGLDEELKNQLRPGFQRLQHLNLIKCGICSDSWPVIQEMLTWLKECVQLKVQSGYCSYGPPWSTTEVELVKDGSLSLNPKFAQKLQSLILADTPVEFVQWILSFCLNMNTLDLIVSDRWNHVNMESACPATLKKPIVQVRTYDTRSFREILRSCHQVQVLNVIFDEATLQDFAELEPTDSIKEMLSSWCEGPSIEEVLPILKRWRHLCRLSLGVPGWEERSVPPFNVLYNFIMEMRHLTHLHFIPSYNRPNRDQVHSLRDEVAEFVLPRRPNFKFDI